MFLAFGLAFEVPIVVIVLVMMGLVTVEQLREWRGYVVVVIFVVAAIVTPPDVVSQIALAVPMCILYEAGIVIAHMMNRRRKAEPGLGKASSEQPRYSSLRGRGRRFPALVARC